jgi:hypothetical protein
MGRRGARLAAMVLPAVVVAALLLGAFPAATAATVTGGCTVTGTSTSGGLIDLTTATVWHVRSSDQISASGGAPFEQSDGAASAYVVGFAIPLASGHSTAEHSVQSDTYDVSTLALLGRIFVLSGSSTGPFHSCVGQVEVIVDDVNPGLTVLGGGGLVMSLLGLLGARWGLRRSESAWRRLVGLVALGLIGAGTSLVLQQTSTPGTLGPGFASSAFVASVGGPLQVSLDPVVLAQSAFLSLLIVLLMPFPAELFNKTLEEHLSEVRGALGRVPLLGLIVGRGAGRETGQMGWFNPVAVLVFVLVSAALYGLLDPGFGLGAASLVTYFGLLVALVAVAWLAALPLRSVHHRLTGDSGRLRAVPWTLLFAALSVLISRAACFLPGYLYGLVIGYAFVREIEERDEGRGLAAGAWWMLGLAFVAWFALGAVRTPGIEPSVPGRIAESVFAAITVGGIEGIVFGLVPLRFLHGEAVFRWRRSRWGVLYGLGLFAFFWIILNPSNGFVGTSSQTELFTALALFVGFGLASVLFWSYFRFRRPRVPV